MTDVDTVPIPEEPLIDYIVALAREGPVHDHTSPPERGHDGDVEWEWSDVDWGVESQPEDGELSVRGFTEGKYSAKTLSATYNPPGKAHPAEYETRTVPVAVTIDVELGDGYDLDLGAPYVEVHNG